VRTSTRRVKRGRKGWREGNKRTWIQTRTGGGTPKKRSECTLESGTHTHTSERNKPRNEITSPRWKNCGWPFTFIPKLFLRLLWFFRQTAALFRQIRTFERSVDGHSHVVIHRGLGLRMKLRFKVQVLGSRTVDERGVHSRKGTPTKLHRCHFHFRRCHGRHYIACGVALLVEKSQMSVRDSSHREIPLWADF